ncbi:HepT-like ribonuclease domain-containing protein [Halegenticoccus soli]|uniref:HepT-like ribonuclease domain-containing protein n=1 Tax=Halegenticoccus soli TaxID=1985678 RepID=UPI000C6D4F91|nr:HepT-like ribonuclease domain-containing protein [Halegenticoccus soli]
MVDEQARLREMLADLEEYLDGLREKQGVPKDRFENDADLQDIVERRLEKATQTCIDIGRLIGRL